MNAPDDATARLYCAQLAALFRRTRTSSALAVLPVILIAGLHAGAVPTAQVVMWGAVMLGVYAVRIAIAYSFQTRPQAGGASPLWLDIEAMTAAAAGGGWGAMLFMLNTGQMDILFALKLAFLAAAGAFTMNSLAVVRFVYLAFLVPVFTIVVGYALMETPFLDATARYGLIVSATLYFALLLIMSDSLGRLLNEALAQQLAYTDLAGRLEAALDAERDSREQLEQQSRQMEATHLQLHLFATHDPLTRVYNRHRINEVLVRELNLRRRYQTPVSALMVEIDGFSGISERCRPVHSDGLLIGFATFLAADLRDIDYVGRCGGAKFCCVLARSDSREARECAERLRKRIAERRFVDALPDLTVTASFGIAEAADGDDPERLLARADVALYAARSNDTPDRPEVAGATTEAAS